MQDLNMPNFIVNQSQHSNEKKLKMLNLKENTPTG